MDHEYLPIGGHVGFIKAAQELMLGADNPVLKEKRVTHFLQRYCSFSFVGSHRSSSFWNRSS